ncbi:MAG: V-type ATP synthase subunit F [Sphaerochaetaceae bacterium]|jgi:V/A-type H+-transporting ATPase subunit F|nr:V-type ATP synthase subunit F [Sphaerochaetaceae bacterium]
MKYFVIGDYDTVMGFSLVGVPGQIASDAAGASSAFDRALDDRQYGIIIITDEIADTIREKVDKYLFSESFPLIVEIPGPSRGGVSRDLHALVNQAIGVAL